jgi:hypothetical protein
MKKIVFVVMTFVVVVSTTVRANDTLRYDAGKCSSDKCFLTKGKVGVVTGIDSILSFVVDKANNQEKVVMYRGGHISFIEWVEANYIKQADPLDNTKIMMTMTGGIGDPLYIAIGGDANSPDTPQAGLLAICLLVVVIVSGVYGAFRFLK